MSKASPAASSRVWPSSAIRRAGPRSAVERGVAAGDDEREEGKLGRGLGRGTPRRCGPRGGSRRRAAGRGRRRAPWPPSSPTSSEPTSPGPWVTAMPSRSLSPTPPRRSAPRDDRHDHLEVRRDASSGTTPAVRRVDGVLGRDDARQHARPSSRTAAAGLVAGGLDAEDDHAPVSSRGARCRARVSESARRRCLAGRYGRPADVGVRVLSRIRRPAFRRSSARWSCAVALHLLGCLLQLHGLAVLADRPPAAAAPAVTGVLGQLDDDVRRDALAVDRAALRREVLRGGQPRARSRRTAG